MITVIQRVSEAKVISDGLLTGSIRKGLLIFLGIETSDSREDADYLVQKIIKLRIFGDESGKMNLSLEDIKGSVLLVSQFTLHADTRKGNRPSYIKAARQELAVSLYEYFKGQVEKALGEKPACGVFGADMKVSLVNDGPVTIIIDSKKR